MQQISFRCDNLKEVILTVGYFFVRLIMWKIKRVSTQLVMSLVVTQSKGNYASYIVYLDRK